MIRRKGNIIVFGRRYCLSIDKRKADQQLLSSLYYPYLSTLIIEQDSVRFYLNFPTGKLFGKLSFLLKKNVTLQP